MDLDCRDVVVVEGDAGDQPTFTVLDAETLTLPRKPNRVVLGHNPGTDAVRFSGDEPSHPCNAPAS